MPATTNMPTHKSNVVRPISQAPLNMIAVITKSNIKIASDEVTTVRVVAPETPSAVGGASKPSNSAITVTTVPNTMLLMTPFMMSSRKSTAACICDQNEPSSTPICTCLLYTSDAAD